MRHLAPCVGVSLAAVLVAALSLHSLRDDAPAGPIRADHPRVSDVYGRLPLTFERNLGQTRADVAFLSRGSDLALLLTPTGAVMQVAGGRVQMTLAGGNPAAEIVGRTRLPGIANYFIGDDPSAWRTDIPTYARVEYHAVYPGIDLVYYGNARELEYDFIVEPGADPGLIALAFEGASSLSIAEAGDLVLGLPGATLRPTGSALIFSTYLGGSNPEFGGHGIAVDAAGNAYVAGQTQSVDFPTTAGAYQTAPGGFSDAFVTKLNPLGTTLVYSTRVGAAAGDVANDIALDAAGNAYVAGTSSGVFPTTPVRFSRWLPVGTTRSS